jgi:Protein of unknown function (DUF3618)
MNPGESASSASASASASASPDPAASDDEIELMAKIDRTRQELGETVEQLATKADVKAQARGLVTRLSTQVKSAAMRFGRKAMAVRTAEGPAQLAVPAVVTATAIAGVLLVIARRRRR